MIAKLYKLPDWLARWRDQIPAQAAAEMEEILGLTREGPNVSSQQHSTGAGKRDAGR